MMAELLIAGRSLGNSFRGHGGGSHGRSSSPGSAAVGGTFLSGGDVYKRQILHYFPYNLYGIFLCLTVFGLITFLLMRMGNDRNGEIVDLTTEETSVSNQIIRGRCV